jgi:ABC-type molybdate transport system substrate-binding protein
MKRFAWLRWKRRVAALVPPVTQTSLVASSFDEIAEPGDLALLATALASLNDQMHEVINRNADGVNRAAITVRRETDLLLSLGISDPFAAKAGSYAQMALELANAGRGVNLRAEAYHLSPKERAELVARAMSFMLRAEMLMGHAKKTNLANIESALAEQEQRMRGARAALACAQP